MAGAQSKRPLRLRQARRAHSETRDKWVVRQWPRERGGRLQLRVLVGQSSLLGEEGYLEKTRFPFTLAPHCAHNTSGARCWFSTPQAVLDTSWCPATQFSSDTAWSWPPVPQGKSPVAQDCPNPPLQMPKFRFSHVFLTS